MKIDFMFENIGNDQLRVPSAVRKICLWFGAKETFKAQEYAVKRKNVKNNKKYRWKTGWVPLFSIKICAKQEKKPVGGWLCDRPPLSTLSACIFATLYTFCSFALPCTWLYQQHWLRSNKTRVVIYYLLLHERLHRARGMTRLVGQVSLSWWKTSLPLTNGGEASTLQMDWKRT